MINNSFKLCFFLQLCKHYVILHHQYLSTCRSEVRVWSQAKYIERDEHAYHIYYAFVFWDFSSTTCGSR